MPNLNSDQLAFTFMAADEATMADFAAFHKEMAAMADREFDEWVAKMEAHEALYGDDLCWDESHVGPKPDWFEDEEDESDESSHEYALWASHDSVETLDGEDL